ncbi:MAG TPA: hypothetical protein VFS08_16215 [Gemmatimonadaceae bacterium]|nr:hypothetical protein [Gemmatimonadaceae bacterium]
MHRPRIRAGRRAAAAALLLAAGLAACGDPLEFEAGFDTVESTVTVHALNDVPIAYAAAVLLAPSPIGVRPAGDYTFDLAVDFDESGAASLYPVDLIAQPGVISIARTVGIQKLTEVAYGDLERAPNSGYTYGEAVPIAVGDVAAIQSNAHPYCANSFLSSTLWAKLEVLALDPAARTARFRVRVDPNCGFRGLQTGRPSR